MSRWAHHAIEALNAGQTCTIRPRGQSMRPRVRSGATVTIAPLADTEPVVGDIVLVRVRGRVYLHIVKATRTEGGATRYLIGNNRGGINGWVSRSAIYGVATDVDNG